MPPPKRKTKVSDLEAESKRQKAAIDAALKEYVCPINRDLPVDPVMAADGRVYDRAAIQEVVNKAVAKYKEEDKDTRGIDKYKYLRSPVKNEPMRPDLVDAVQARNTIRALLESGSEGLVGDIADRWKEVDALRKKAEAGDALAMYDLGDWYYTGKKGLLNDETIAFRWTKKAADLGCVIGIADQGYMLYHGNGVKKDQGEGLALIGIAAGKGSSLGAFYLARCYAWEENFKGPIIKNPQKAKHWYEMAIEYSKKGTDGDALSPENLKMAEDYLANFDSA